MLKTNLILGIVATLLLGCTPLTEEQRQEREWKDLVDKTNLEICTRKYEEAGKPTVHIGHTHSRPQTGVNRRWNTKSDLITNRCKIILGDSWSSY